MHQIVIHYGELSTKRRNRKVFQNKLAENIRFQTKNYGRVKIVTNHDFMHLSWEDIPLETIIDLLKNIPGIARFEPVHRVEKNIDQIKEKALELFKELDILPGQTFRIVAKRSDKSFEYDTMALQREVGFLIGEAFPELSVDLKQPTYQLTISVHQTTGVNLSLKSYPGLGGLPYGTSGKGLLMLSGGFDSPIAGYQMIKRGMTLDVVHFSSPPYTSPQALDKTKRLTAVLSTYSDGINFINIPFTEIQVEIKKNIPDELSMPIMRRMMLRLMDQLLPHRNAMAIINGESLGQVASQTLESMTVINAVTNSPILRPLIATDKNEIIAIAERIGTYDISNEPYEDCCTVFAPTSPKTKPKLTVIEALEQTFEWQPLIKKAIQNMTIEKIDRSYLESSSHQFTELL